MSFLAARPQVSGGRIGALGVSLGGEGALGAAAADGRIRAVVAEGVTGRTAADDGTRPTGVLRPVVAAGWTILEAEVRLLSDRTRPEPLVEAVRTARCPVLLVAAGTQERERRTARSAQQAAPQRVVVEVVPGAAHARALDADPARWERVVVGFLDGALGP